MNADLIRGALREIAGKWLEELGLFAGNHHLAIRGKHEQLLGRLQTQYGALRARSDRNIATWVGRRA